MDQKSTKRRFRITIRIIMLAILFLAVGFGIPLRQVERQEAAVAQISGLGGVVGFDYNYLPERGNYPPWPSGDPRLPEWLRLGGLIGGSAGAPRGPLNEGLPVPRWLLKPLGPEFFRTANFVSVADFNQKLRPVPDLAFLGALPDVRALQLDSRSFADAELAHARPLKLIRFLAKDSSLGDEGLAQLGDQPELWEIDLSGTRVTDAGLAYLARMPNLKFVDLSGLKITDAGLAHLAHLAKLENLGLTDTTINGEGLLLLRGLKQISLIDLRGTRLSNATLPRFKDLSSVKALFLSRTQVTDEGLIYLKAVPGLKTVELIEASVTNQGVADLQRAMPNLRIQRR